MPLGSHLLLSKQLRAVYPFPMLGRRLGLFSTLRLGCRLSGVIWIGTALSRSGVVNYVDSVAMLGIHKLKVLEMAKAAETARVRPNLLDLVGC